MEKFKYETIRMLNRGVSVPPFPRRSATASNRANALGAVVWLFHELQISITNNLLDRRIERELRDIEGGFEDRMTTYEGIRQCQNDTGVLVVFAIEEVELPSGQISNSFLSINIAGVGRIATNVIQRYLAVPGYVLGPRYGGQRIKTYIWATRKFRCKPPRRLLE